MLAKLKDHEVFLFNLAFDLKAFVFLEVVDPYDVGMTTQFFGNHKLEMRVLLALIVFVGFEDFDAEILFVTVGILHQVQFGLVAVANL